MIVLVDNYDSFTFNLVHYLGGLGADVAVHRNDKIAVEDVLAAEPEAIVLSPGPCTPERSRHLPRSDRTGIADRCRSSASASAIRPSARRSAARSCARRVPVHGKLSEMRHQGDGVFRGINGPFKATRYHSLVVERDTMPDDAQRHRRNRRRSGHGARAQDAAGAWRAISSRKHRVRARPSDAEEFSRACRAVERRAAAGREACIEEAL